MKENNKIYKTIVYVVLLTGGLFIHNFSKGQSVGHAYGSYCVGSMNVFYYAGPGGATAWYTDGTVIANNGSSIQVVWNNPTSYAYVNCTYNDGYGHYGSTSLYPIVISSSVTPSVSISTGSTNICSGSSATFTASPVNGGSSPYYTWYVGGSVVSSGYGNTFTTSSLTNGQQVSCTMNSNASCITTSTVSSNVITMSVSSPQTLNVTISGNTSVCQGSGTSLSASVSNPTGTLIYQWKKNGYNVTSDNQYAPVYVLVQNTVNNGDVFSCVVSSNSCANPGTSNSLTISITQPQPFWISTSVNPISYCPGASLTFTASSSHSAYNYQWSMNGSAVPGATGSTFTTTATSVAQLQSVSVSAYTSASCVSNTYATGSAQYIPFTIYSQPTVSGNLTVSSGSSTTLTANGNTPTYRWYDANGNQIFQGAQYITSTSLTPGTYTYQVRGATSDGSCLTDAVSVTVTVDYPTISYTPIYSSSNFTKTIDLSKPVGTINGSPGTTPSGGVTYTIPIYAPPGTNGVQPSISISYNSQFANGIVGYGWNISGLSVIGRAGQTIFHNNNVVPVTYTTTDAFVLDGMRLKPTSGSNGANNAIYATEMEGFSKIISYTSGSANNPDWFKVIMKDGTVMEFGNTVDSRILTDDGQNVMLWRLNKIIDVNGNYAEFKYDNVYRDSRIDQISYTGNANTGLTSYNTIKFEYALRNDQSVAYEGGASLKSRLLLKAITVKNDGALTKAYSFNYGFDNIVSLLKEVIESGSDGTALNSTIFLYGDAVSDLQSQASTALTGSHEFFTGDFDADGKSDLLSTDYYYSNGTKYHSGYQLLGDITGTSSTVMYIKDLTPPGGSISDMLRNQFSRNNFAGADYDGDGRDDIVTANTTLATISNNPFTQSYVFNILTINYTKSHNPNTGFFDYTPVTNDLFAGMYCPTSNFFVPGDFDGDGNKDYILILSGYPNQNPSWPFNYYYSFRGYMNSPSTSTSNQEVTNMDCGKIVYAKKLFTGDFDGDGKDEILAAQSGFSTILRLTRTLTPTGYTFQSENWQSLRPNDVDGDNPIYIGDFNGDRKSDILTRNSSGVWNILYSTGTGFVTVPFTFNQTPNITGATSDDKIIVSDFNGDGKTDIVHGFLVWVNGVANTSKFSVYYSTGGVNAFYYQQYNYNKVLSNLELTTGDFNGDGRTDILNRPSASSPVDFITFKPLGKERLLAKVTDGHNVTTAFDYKLLTDANGTPDFYQRTISLDDAANRDPFNFVQLPLYAVSSVTTPNGIGGLATTTFKYQDAVIHRNAKGFLGFKKVTSQNLATGITMESQMDLNNQFALLYPKKQVSSITSTGQPLSESDFTYSFSNFVQSGMPYGIQCYQKLEKQLDINHLTGAASETLNTYDFYGNITTIVLNTGTLSGSSVNAIETTTITTAFGTHNTPVPAKPDQVTVSTTRSGSPTVSATTQYSYNGVGLVSSQINFAGLPKAVTTSYTYDGFGNVTNVTKSATGVTTGVIDNTYDSKGRFVVTRKAATGSAIEQTETFTYDGKWGTPLTSVSTDKISTQYEYDGFGRLKKTTEPVFTTTYSSNWDLQGNNIYYSQIHYNGGRPDSKVWIDQLGRQTTKQIAGFNNQWLTSNTTYDSKGNIATTTNAYYPGETPITSTNSYDVYNRIQSLSNGIKTINYSYTSLGSGNLQATVTDQTGQSSSKTTDATGKVISSTDNGGDLYFTYDSRGAETEVKHGAVSLVTMTYDDYGRQLSLTDKNSGTVSYVYDAFGELTQQTDSKGNVYNMTYDALGRLISKQGPPQEGTTTYEYFKNAANGATNNSLQKVTGFNNIIKEYTYDNLNRLQSEKVTVDAVPYVTQYGYDAFSNLNKITYPSGIEVNNTFDNNGQLYLVTAGNPGSQTTVFNGTQMNGFGQFTSYALANNRNSQISYQYGVPTRYYTQGIQDLNFTWDYAKGNLLNRRDDIKGNTENFDYDGLNRLIKTTVNGQVQLNLTYDGTPSFSKGNIISKTDAGNYTYKTDKIHAIAYITSQNPYSVSTIGQTITYSPFQKALTINEDNVNQIAFTYGPDYERIKTQLSVNNTVTETKYFIGNYEKQIDQNGSREIHYINGGNGLSAILVRQNSVNNIYVAYTDYLGSILTLTDLNGNIVAEQNFDAWGRKRNTSDWTYNSVSAVPAWLYRGFTGHEHLPQFGLINMNGRLYDPIQGRMISPDNYVPNPYLTQGYNRYTYGNNNPLTYVDPDGNLWFVPILIGAYIGGVMGGIQAERNGGDFTMGFIGGAIAGGITGSLGLALNGMGAFAHFGMMGSGAFDGAITGFVGGGLSSMLNGQSFFNGAFSGAMLGFVAGGITGYLKRASLGSEAFGDPGFSNNGEYFSSEKDLDDFIKKNMGDVDKIESTLRTDYSLGSATNLPPSDAYNDYGFDPTSRKLYVVPKGSTHGNLLGGVTSPDPNTGYTTPLRTHVRISPGLKGDFYDGQRVAHMVISHETLHAWHYSAGLWSGRTDPVFDAKTERAAHMYSLAYSKAYNMPTLIASERYYVNFSNKIGYGWEYSWQTFYKKFGSFINVGGTPK